MPTTRSPLLALDSLEGTPGGACWSAQKDASASRSLYMAFLPVWAAGEEIVARDSRRLPELFERPVGRATARHDKLRGADLRPSVALHR
jgi:hypothetical protein